MKSFQIAVKAVQDLEEVVDVLSIRKVEPLATATGAMVSFVLEATTERYEQAYVVDIISIKFESYEITKL